MEHNFLTNRKTIDPANRYRENQFDRKSERPDEGQDQHVFHNVKPSDIISKERKDKKTAKKEKEIKKLKYRANQFDHKSERPDEGQDQHVCGNVKPSDIISKERMDKETAKKEKEIKKLKEKIKKLEEEVSSLKDKVAKEVALSIKTGKTESLNNPVSQTRLKEMYDDLRLHWPKIKKHLKSNKEKPDSVKKNIQDAFENAKREVSVLRHQMNKLIDEQNPSDEVLQKVTQLKQSAAQELQLALYHTRNHDEVLDQECTSVKTEDIMKDLLSACSWLGQLMALNNPTIQPDWENHTPGMDTWHILPRNLCSKTG